MKKIISTVVFLMTLISYSQTRGRITYKTFPATVKATEKLKKENIEEYREALDEETMARSLIFKLDFNENESLFSLHKNLTSEHEDQIVSEYVVGKYYGHNKSYIDIKRDTLIEQVEYIFGKVLKPYKASFVKWNLTKESKIISGYKCYKATYVFMKKWRGREFPQEVVAWYTPEIPISYGPIRYNGLPGLILELTEKDKGYIVDKIEFSDKKVKIKEPKKGEFLTDKEITKRMRKAKMNMLKGK